MQLEQLEPRQLLAGLGPQLFGVQPSDGDLFSLDPQNPTVRNVAPRELSLLFDDLQQISTGSLDGIRILRAGGDSRFDLVSTDFNTGGRVSVAFEALGDAKFDTGLTIEISKSDHLVGSVPAGPIVSVSGDIVSIDLDTRGTTAAQLRDAVNAHPGLDGLMSASVVSGDETIDVSLSDVNYSPLVFNEEITPGFKGVKSAPDDNEVILRFAETLPDDLYRIEVFGQPNAAQGISRPLSSTNGGDFMPQLDADPSVPGDRQRVEFDLQLGAEVVSIVPQPVTRDVRQITVAGAANGNFTLTVGDEITAVLNSTALTATQLQNALEQLNAIREGDVRVTGLGAGETGPFQVAFHGRYQTIHAPDLVANGILLDIDDVSALQDGDRIRVVDGSADVRVFELDSDSNRSHAGTILVDIATLDEAGVAVALADAINAQGFASRASTSGSRVHLAVVSALDLVNVANPGTAFTVDGLPSGTTIGVTQADTLSQARDQVVVYFTDDDLFTDFVRGPDGTPVSPPTPTEESIENPNFFRLIATGDTVSNTDDVVFKPIKVTYDPTIDAAVLTFADDLDQLPDPRPDRTGEVLTNPGSFRLRVGTNEELPLAPNRVAPTVSTTVKFNAGAGDEVDIRFEADSQFAESFGNALVVLLTKSNHGALSLPAGPVISLDGSTLTVDLNEQAVASSDNEAIDVVTAINNHPTISAVISASIDSGVQTASIAPGLVNGTRVRMTGLGSSFDTASDLTGVFDIGSVLKVDGDGSDITDGQTFRIVDEDGDSQAFEFTDTTGVVNDMDAVEVLFAAGDSTGDVVAALRDAINSAAFKVTASDDGNLIRLQQDRSLDIDDGVTVISEASAQGIILTSQIDPQPFLLDLPGTSDEPGHRELATEVGDGFEQHINRFFDLDQANGVQTVRYNFRTDFAPGETNQLNNVQRDTIRKALDVWANYLGVQFLETETEGLTIASGDLTLLNNSEPDVVSINFGRVRVDPEFERPMILMNGQTQFNNEFGQNLFQAVLTGVGYALGLGRAEELPAGTLMSGALIPSDPVFPGNFDILHGQLVHRPDSNDLDVFKFDVDLSQIGSESKTAVFSAETFSERLAESSLLDTVLSLYREVDVVDEAGTVTGVRRELIARNDDYYGNDSFLTVDLEVGTYYVVVSSTGNTNFDPNRENSGFGGRTQGIYDLRMNLRGQVAESDVIRDNDAGGAVPGTALDGDSDGTPGGVHNYWFQTDRLNRGLKVQGTGDIFVDTQRITITDNGGEVRRFEMDDDFSSLDTAIEFGAGDSAQTIAGRLVSAINGAGFGVSAFISPHDDSLVLLMGEQSMSLGTGFVGLGIEGKTIFVDKTPGGAADGTLGAPFVRIPEALAVTHPGDIVRIIGNGGVDGDRTTVDDNLPYDIGIGTFAGQTLADGEMLDVPQGVTVMIDAGAIFKMRASRIGVGSSTSGINRSNGALQVLGTPRENVIFTSFLDEVVGQDNNPPGTLPRAGDWGGIVFRSDLDDAAARFNLENEGIFLNHVAAADIRYGGGGNVVINSQQQIVNPIQIIDVRPTVRFNKISDSGDSAMSAAPDSFEETNFHSPEFQVSGIFTSDYDRVGPEIHGNLLVNNSTNGLFIRIETLAGSDLTKLTVPARFDDIDITHVISENLIIEGAPGAPKVVQTRPDGALISGTPLRGGFLQPGNYNYRMVFFDRSGFEGRPSDISPDVIVAAGEGTIRLTNLPPVPSGTSFIGRRIYRSDNTGNGPYHLVASLNATDNAFNDDGLFTGVELKGDFLPVSTVSLSAQPNGGLAAGTYNYRVVLVDANGVEQRASDPTEVVTIAGNPNPDGSLGGNGTVRVSNLPGAPAGFARRVYRSSATGVLPYVQVAEFADGDATTTFDDTGITFSRTLAPSAIGVTRADIAARLAVDPGTVVKIEGSRIEASFGAQFLAEGLPGREVIFTSKLDDTYGAGGTFDTNNDNALTTTQTPGQGNWGGIYLGHLSSGSIDHARLAYGGGETKIESTFRNFNVIEVHQADLRLTNSLIEQNGTGFGGIGPSTRFGRGTNSPATIFVRGAQPVIVNNTIQDNVSDAITIDLNSMTHDLVVDPGRSTGQLDRIEGFRDNQGPLVRLNRMDGNGINGMEIRGGTLTDESVWDDTDIVHVVNGSVTIPNFHTFGGLRLESSPNESLVVKFAAASGTIQATGANLEIEDRIGGMLHVVGQPGFPVVLTSLNDSSVGAGLKPDGSALTETRRNAPVPTSGSWQGINLDHLSHDRNVAVIMERESSLETAPGTNATVNTAQVLGALTAPGQPGDENLRNGFTVHGFLNETGDVDIFSFSATAGTEVWLDIDRTDPLLDTVLEIVDPNGVILGQSNDSLAESQDPSLLYRDSDPARIPAQNVNPLNKANDTFQPKHASGLIKDFWSSNASDAGMRVVLPGSDGVRSTYFVRVRSNNLGVNDDPSRLQDPAALFEGLSLGVYQLQVRTGEIDVFPGSTIQHADIRYTETGITATGLPKHSPLVGESREDEFYSGLNDNDNFNGDPARPLARPQDLGNLFASDRAVLSVGGNIQGAADVDHYQFNLNYQQVISSTTGTYGSTVFDIDYASGLQRADTSLWVYSNSGQLLFVGRDSNVLDDQPGPTPAPGDTADMADLSRGSADVEDPFIGPVELPLGTYKVAVTSNVRQQSEMDQFTSATATNSLVRLEPINSVRRLAEDRIGSFGGTTADPPVNRILFDASSRVPNAAGNLWHITSLRANDAGHGINASFDQSRTAVDGGQSFYFGEEGSQTTGSTDTDGRIVSRTFDLKGYSADDLPVLYFNYFLSAGANDTFTVHVNDENGTDVEIASNATFGGSTALFNSAGWRQARIDLGQFAGQSSLELIFDYDTNGSPGSEGAYVDDIIIGFAERGEMVTNSAGGVPTYTFDFLGGGLTSGDYQLEIRKGTDFGTDGLTFLTPLVLNDTFDTNDRHNQQTSFFAPAGSAIVDGDTFDLGDGVETLTFEFDVNGTIAPGNVRVNFTSTDADFTVAQRIRNAINSPSVQGVLNVQAALSDGSVSGTSSTSNQIALFGNAVIDVFESTVDPLIVTGTTTEGQELRDFILGEGITPVGPALYFGGTESSGFFSQGSSSIGIDRGIVLTTGNASDVQGPNVDDGSSAVSTGVGDGDLDAAFPDTTADATWLQFDFQFGDGTAGGDLEFDFVFASEEYNEFVNSAFNDVFAFFLTEDVNGTNGGPFPTQNLAVVPGTTTPITINTINNGGPLLGQGAVSNPNLYVNNDLTDGAPFRREFGFDGFTTVLQAAASGLGPGVHRIKLAIADTTDDQLDSAVMIAADSFSVGGTTPPPPPAPTGFPGTIHDGFGDSNHDRDQGQLIIDSNVISDFHSFGIATDEAPRQRANGDPPGINLGSPLQGNTRNLAAVNGSVASGGFAPGVVIVNNTIYGEGVAGVHVSGNIRPWEIVPPRPADFPNQDTPNMTAGDSINDGELFRVTAYGQTVTFEFEDIQGSPANDAARVAPRGSGIQGGNGWTEGNIPVFYRRTHTAQWVPGSGRLLGSTQQELVTAINDAIRGSILFRNDTVLTINTVASLSMTSTFTDPLTMGTTRDPALFLEHATVSIPPGGVNFQTNRTVPTQFAPEPFARLTNNTLFGADGTFSRQVVFTATETVNANDTIADAIDSRQGRQAFPNSFTINNAIIGDSPNFSEDPSLDVDFYQAQLDIGNTLEVNVTGLQFGGATLDPALAVFTAEGERLACNTAGGPNCVTNGTTVTLNFTAPEDATYYVGVSGVGNEEYDARSLLNRTGAASRGRYTIDINVRAPRQWRIEATDGTTYTDGTMFHVENINGGITTYEFDTGNGVAAGNVAIVFDNSAIPPNGNRGPGYRAPEMAALIARALGGTTYGLTGGWDSPATTISSGAFPERSANPAIWILVNGPARIFDDATNPSGIMVNTTNDNQLIPESGVLISENADPTLLNNAIANWNRGVTTTNGGTAIVAGTVWQYNNTPGSLGVGGNFILASALRHLFVNAPDGNFIPATASEAIDSAVDSLEDRPAFVAIKDANGLGLSPILAPDRDGQGLLRVDDPTFANPNAQGANIFKDRGALDRADFVGPSAELLIPLDNDVQGVDIDPAATVVQLTGGQTLDNFTIQLIDGFEVSDPFPGLGIDKSTVVRLRDPLGSDLGPVIGDGLTIFEDGRFLIENVDYTFNFIETDQTLRLTPASGNWADNKVYQIRLNNRDRSVIHLLPGDQINDGDQFAITDQSGTTVTFQYESGFQMILPRTLTMQVPVEGVNTGGIRDGQRFTYSDGTTTTTFEFDTNGTISPFADFGLAVEEGIGQLRLANAILQQLKTLGLAGAKLIEDSDGRFTGEIHMGAPLNASLQTSLSDLRQPGDTLGVSVPTNGEAGILEGQTFQIVQDTPAGPVTTTFEFDRNQILNNNLRVPVDISAAVTQDEVADAIVSAVGSAGLGATPVHVGGGLVHFGLGSNDQVSASLVAGAVNAVGINRTVADGQTFSVTFDDGTNPATTTTFEFDSDGTVVDVDGTAGPDNQIIPLAADFSETSLEIMDKIAAAIDVADDGIVNEQGLGLTPVHFGQGRMHLGGIPGHSIDVSNAAPLSITGNPISGVPSTTLVVPDNKLELFLPADGALSIADNESFVISDGTFTETFEFNLDGMQTIAGARVINFTRFDDIDTLANNIINEINLSLVGGTLNPTTAAGSGVIDLGADVIHTVNTNNTAVNVVGGFIKHLDTFSISLNSATVNFQFIDTEVSNTSVATDVVFSSLNSTREDIAAAIVLAIQNQSTTLNLNPVDAGNGVIELLDTVNHVTDIPPTAGLSKFGVPGGIETIQYQQDSSFTSVDVFEAVSEAIANSQLTGVAVAPRGGTTFFIDGTTQLQDLNSFFVPAIRDLAGNPLKANQPNNETRFTILLNAQLDFGDALDPNQAVVNPLTGRYPTLFERDGARHVITTTALTLGQSVDGDLVSGSPNGRPTPRADGDDFDFTFDFAGSPMFAAPTRLADGTAVIVPATAMGMADVNDGDTFTLTDGIRTVTFEFEDPNNAFGFVRGNQPINFAQGVDDANTLARAMVNAIKTAGFDVDVETGARILFNDGTSLIVPDDGTGLAAVADGQTFTLFNQSVPVTFEFEDASVAAGVGQGNQPVPIMRGMDDPATVANAIITAMTTAGINASPTLVAGAEFRLHEDDEDGVEFGLRANTVVVIDPTQDHGGPLGLVDRPAIERIIRGRATPFTITSSGEGRLDAWIDFNRNGSFTDPGEQIFNSVLVQPGVNVANPASGFLMANIPNSATSNTETVARFRLSSGGGLLPSGLAVDGEVEDYIVRVISNTPPVANAVTDITHNEDELVTEVIDIAPFFFDPDISNGNGDFLTFELPDGNSADPTLVDASLTGSMLTLTYQAEKHGTTSVRLKATDHADEMGIGVLNITVHPVNDQPTANAQTVVVAEDTPITITVSGDDGDPDDDQLLTFSVFFAPGDGGLSNVFGPTPPAAGHNQVTYTPRADFNGDDSFAFLVTDNGVSGPVPVNDPLASPAATVTITVTPVNDRPTADPKVLNINEDEPDVGLRTIQLTGDDNDPEVDQVLTFNIVNAPGKGSLTPVLQSGVPVPGRFVYTPSPDVNGLDTFTYTVTDDGQAGPGTGETSVPATVTININALNDPPVASDDATLQTLEEQSIDFDLIADDGDPGVNQTLTYELLSAPPNGQIVFLDAGNMPLPATTITSTSPRVRFTPDVNFSGLNAFTFSVTDDDQAGPVINLSSNIATVTIDVLPINDPPVATGTNPDPLVTDEDTPIDFFLTGEDGDPAVTQVLTFLRDFTDANPTLGTLQFLDDSGNPLGVNQNTSGRVRYTPNANVSGVDNFSFQVEDDDQAGTPLGQMIPAGLRSEMAQSVAITINSINDRPIATPLSTSLDEDTINGSIQLTGDDNDPEMQNLTFTITEFPEHGTLLDFGGGQFVNAQGQAEYSPDPNYHGPDSFAFVVTDEAIGGSPALTSIPATVSLTVNPVNDVPVAQSGSATLNEDTSRDVRLVANDGDPNDTQSLTYTIRTMPTNGTLDLSGLANGIVRYTPFPNFHSQRDGFLVTDSFRFSVRDDDTAGGPALESLTETITLQVNPVNDAPVAQNIPATVTGQRPTVSEDPIDPGGNPRPLTIMLPASDPSDDPFDRPQQTLTYSLVTSPTNGVVTINPQTGQADYLPNADFHGLDSFTWRVTDNGTPPRSSTTATVSIDVTSVNDIPVALPLSIELDEDPGQNGIGVGVLQGESGAANEQQSLRFAIVDSPANGALTSFDPITGAFAYVPDANYHGADSFTFAVTDDATAGGPARTSLPETVSITVNPINDPPTADPQTVTLDEDATHVDAGQNVVPGHPITLTGNDGDDGPPDDLQQLIFEIATPPAHGRITSFDALAGTLVYVPDANYHGDTDPDTIDDFFTFTVRDDNTAGGEALTTPPTQVDLKITPDNDAPEVVASIPGEDPALFPPIADIVIAEDSPDFEVELFPKVFQDVDVLTTNDMLSVQVIGNTNPQLVRTQLNPGVDSTILLLDLQPNEHGTSTITLQARDLAGETVETTFDVIVNSVNDRPTAGNDLARTRRNTPVVIRVLDNDNDAADAPQGSINPNSIRIVTPSLNGSAQINSNGTITFTPANNFLGQTSFTYAVSDQGSTDPINQVRESNVARVTINVLDPPNTTPDSVTTDENTSVVIAVLQNDTDSDGFIVQSTVNVVTNPANGTVGINPATGEVTYTPNASFSGTDSFQYTVEDNDGVTSAPTQVLITVNEVFEFNNPSNIFDVNDDGFVSPIDALLVINDIKNNGPRLLPDPPNQNQAPGFPPPFLDVNGDGAVTSGDAQAVIRELNNRTQRPGEGEPLSVNAVPSAEVPSSEIARGLASGGETVSPIVAAPLVQPLTPAANQSLHTTGDRSNAERGAPVTDIARDAVLAAGLDIDSLLMDDLVSDLPEDDRIDGLLEDIAPNDIALDELLRG